MATWLITGAGGWLGRAVVEDLLPRMGAGDRLVAIGRNRPRTSNGLHFLPVDLRDAGDVARRVGEASPDFVIHAAGKTPPAADAELHEANVTATKNLLEALHGLGRRVRLVVAGSAAELGPIDPADLPVLEDRECRPTTPYGRSKAAATALAMEAADPVEVVVGRIFNLVGPGMPDSLAFGRFAFQLADRRGGPIRIRTGRLDSRRDFVDVRDAGRAIVALAGRGRARRIYNVASGVSASIEEGLDLLIRMSGRAVERELDPEALRPSEPDDTRASIERITTEVDWRPSIPLDASLAALWDGVATSADTSLTLTGEEALL